jgi:hypothetical protein
VIRRAALAVLIGVLVIAFLFGIKSDKSVASVVPSAAENTSPLYPKVVGIIENADKVTLSKNGWPNRRVSNGEQVTRLTGLAMKRKQSVDFSGYWQRHKEETAH